MKYLVKTDGGFQPSASPDKLPPTLRKHKRAHLQGYVYIHDDLRLYIAPLRDISEGGMFINLLTAIPAGSVVKIVIKSPRLDAPIQVHGTVIRVESEKRRGLAVEFRTVNALAHEMIKECVVELTNDELSQITNLN